MRHTKHRMQLVDPFKEAEHTLRHSFRAPYISRYWHDNRLPDLKDEEIGLHSSYHQEFAGYSLRRIGHNPTKRIVLRVEANNTCGNRVVRHLRFRGCHVDKAHAVVSHSTFQALNSLNADSSHPTFVCVRKLWQPLGRYLFYWNHPDDAARVSFKTAVYGLILGALSIYYENLIAIVCSVM